MIILNSPVTSLNKVGPKYKTLLEKLEIFKVEDLLYHFPFRYDDFGNFKKIRDLEPNELVTVQAILGPVENIYTKYRKRITKAVLVDHTGEIEVIWFNQHYLKKTLKTGKEYLFSGKVQLYNGKLSFVAPEFEEKKGDSVNTGRLVPVYPETYGITSKWLRNKIHTLLESSTDLKEFLPEKLLDREGFYDVAKGMNQIHFPDGKFEAEQARKRFAYEELFMELLNVEKRKFDWSVELRGVEMKNKFKKEIDDFIKNLPFKLTTTQETSVAEITHDLMQKHPMNRLLEGDVGTGKTIVAVIAAYFSYLNGNKILYMAPTEILAKQHFETFSELLKSYGCRVGLATSSRKKSIKSDEYDILIGTHALLFNLDKYENIGLIIIDEQHRFGVEQRGQLVNMNVGELTPHLLTMTATPIPRTLALTIYGDLSISALKNRPDNKRRVSTKVIPERQREKAYNWILEKNEPTFIVCPLIEESQHETMENVKAAEAEYEKLKKGVFKGVSIGLLHGRMKSKEKEEVVEKFKNGKIKVLVSTPVIEVGIDVPEATVMVIESAERYGLASLHQLRGRVGRGDKEGFCFVFLSSRSRNAYTRLKNLENIDNGLELAEIDMKLRGQGDIFGTMQSGFKRFKIAQLENLEMLETAKMDAQNYFKRLEEFPLLKQKIIDRKGNFVTNN